MTKGNRTRLAGLLISHAFLLVLLLIGVLVVGWWATPVYAATINVDDAGTDSPTCGDVADPCETIPYALSNRASSGDTVFVWEGTYTEIVTLKAGIIISGAGATRTFIDGEGIRGPMVSASGSMIDQSTVLRGVTIRRGTAADGGGVSITSGASPLIEDCIVSENVAAGTGPFNSGYGGGLYVNSNATLILRDTEVLSNTANYRGGGMYQTGGSRLSLFGGRFENNEATGNHGGGLWIAGTVVMTGTEFVNNRANGNGGGIWQLGPMRCVELIGGRLEGNRAGTANYNGGGLATEGTAILSATQVVSNSAGQWGGGVSANDAQVTGATFVNNRSGQRGGGLYAASSIAMTGTSVISNTANLQGGGVAGEGEVSIVNSLFARNSATAGAAVWMYSDTAVQNRLRHLTIVSPTVGSGYSSAAAILVYDAATAMITNTIIGGYPYAIEAFQNGTAHEDYNLYYNLGTAAFNENQGSIHNGTHSLYNLDPHFLNPSGDNFHINSESAALDAGDFLGVIDDWDGDPRPTNTVRPDAPDIGYDENKSLTVHRPIADHVIFGAACAGIAFTDTASLSSITATVYYTYPTDQEDDKPLPRYYVLEPDDSGSCTAILTLCYTQDEFQESGVADENDLQLYRLGDEGWEPYNSTVDTDNNIVVAGGVTEFSRWAIGGPGGEPTAVDLDFLIALPAGQAIRVEWETVTEIDTLGFHIYRAGSPDDEPVRLTRDLIPSQNPGGLMGGRYEFLDRAVKPGCAYYYWLEDVDVYGTATRHGPVSALLLHRYYLPLIRR